MNRAEKAKLLQSLSNTTVIPAAPAAKKAIRTFEIDGVQVQYEAERGEVSEEHKQVNRDLLRQARAKAERNDD